MKGDLAFAVVAGTAAKDAWAVGTGGTALHYDGRAWSAAPAGTTNPLAAVWADSPEDAWAVGSGGTVLRWNGSAWLR